MGEWRLRMRMLDTSGNCLTCQMSHFPAKSQTVEVLHVNNALHMNCTVSSVNELDE
jgi:hypothetical protein